MAWRRVDDNPLFEQMGALFADIHLRHLALMC